MYVDAAARCLCSVTRSVVKGVPTYKIMETGEDSVGQCTIERCVPTIPSSQY